MDQRLKQEDQYVRERFMRQQEKASILWCAAEARQDCGGMAAVAAPSGTAGFAAGRQAGGCAGAGAMAAFRTAAEAQYCAGAVDSRAKH